MSDMHSKNEQEFDRFSRTYEEEMRKALPAGAKDHDFFTRAKARRLITLAHENIGDPAGLAVLDVGCGTGITLGELSSRFALATGVDVSDSMIEEARRRFPACTFKAFDGTVIPAADASFDVVYAINVFHHVPPPMRLALISDMARVTKPGGLVALFEHNGRHPLTMRVVNSCAFDEDAILLPTQESKDLLGRAGLQAIRARYIIFIPFWDWISDRIDDLLGCIPAGTQYYAMGRKTG